MALIDAVKKITSSDLFSRGKDGALESGTYVGRPFHVDFDRMYVLMPTHGSSKPEESRLDRSFSHITKTRTRFQKHCFCESSLTQNFQQTMT
jgi:hypothetical protein